VTLFEPGAVVELRVLDTSRGVVCGYFDDFEKLAVAAVRLSGKGSGVYVTLNSVDPELIARAANRMKEFAKKTTGDGDVLRRRWLPIDIDPKRPSGICATDAEHEAAVQRALKVSAGLAEGGWPRPVMVDSGNGVYLLYRNSISPTIGLLRISSRFVSRLWICSSGTSTSTLMRPLVGPPS
jgi:hypothetical protein